MKRYQRKKLFFPLGIISFAVISFLGFRQIAKIYSKRTAPQHVLELAYGYSDKKDPDCIFCIEKISRQRKYELFQLTSNSIYNSVILSDAKLALNKIKANHDTINGIRIAFDDSTHYTDFIKSVDYCYEKFPAIFYPYENSIWAFYQYVDTSGWAESRRQRELEKTQGNSHPHFID